MTFMFSGIVEATGRLLSWKNLNNAVQVQIERPTHFDDIKTGDSIAINGACLTVEFFSAESVTFTLAQETLKILQWTPQNWSEKKVNMERSLRFGDRIHGHLVTGHVDSLGKISGVNAQGDSLVLDVEVGDSLLPYIWHKGSLTINGVSLTLNSVQGHLVSVCLIPETLKRTNLAELKVGDAVTLEPDYFAKALKRHWELSKPESNLQGARHV